MTAVGRVTVTIRATRAGQATALVIDRLRQAQTRRLLPHVGEPLTNKERPLRDHLLFLTHGRIWAYLLLRPSGL